MSEMRSRIILQSDKEKGVTAYDRKKDEAWNNYVETAQRRGEEDTITQFRFFIFVLRCYMGMVKEYVSATKDLVNEINDISEEVNSLVEMDLQSTERFTYNIEKYPRFMRGFAEKANSPIRATPSGMTASERQVPEKARAPISVKPSGKTAEEREEQKKNV